MPSKRMSIRFIKKTIVYCRQYLARQLEIFDMEMNILVESYAENSRQSRAEALTYYGSVSRARNSPTANLDKYVVKHYVCYRACHLRYHYKFCLSRSLQKSCLQKSFKTYLHKYADRDNGANTDILFASRNNFVNSFLSYALREFDLKLKKSTAKSKSQYYENQ